MHCASVDLRAAGSGDAGGGEGATMRLGEGRYVIESEPTAFGVALGAE